MINNSIGKLTFGYQNCNTSEMNRFLVGISRLEKLSILELLFGINTIQNHIDIEEILPKSEFQGFLHDIWILMVTKS